MSRSQILRCLSVYGLLLFMAGCVTAPPPPPPNPEPPRKQSYWRGEGVAGDPSIIIDLTEQRAHFFKGRQEVGQSLISSGKKGFGTPTGDFKVIQRDRNHVSNLYGDFADESGVVERNVDTSKQKAPEGTTFQGARMPFFLRFTAGVGMHAGRLPGRPASHGCVRLPRFMAEHFYNNAPVGTPVTVR